MAVEEDYILLCVACADKEATRLMGDTELCEWCYQAEVETQKRERLAGTLGNEDD